MFASTFLALPAELIAGPPGLAMAAALMGVTLLLLVWAAARLAAMPAPGPAVPWGVRARRPAFVRLTAPDVPGRPRPRAP